MDETKQKQIDILFHAESGVAEIEKAKEQGRAVDVEMLERRFWAVIYLMQEVMYGIKPLNYAEVMAFPEDQLED